jgi:hypothetical protein
MKKETISKKKVARRKPLSYKRRFENLRGENYVMGQVLRVTREQLQAVANRAIAIQRNGNPRRKWGTL